ncbi:MAG: nicotinate-nucleotide adenylyltransferase [Pyrinomonadaceae bacterium]
MKKAAFYGGTFDPVHCGHITIAKRLVELFGLDEFYFVPAFHAPHKPDRSPTSAYHRFAMLTAATENEPLLKVSLIELSRREKRYTIDTLNEILAERPDDQIFFVMGADSWNDIRTWRDWERLLLLTNHVVVSRPGHEISIDHVGVEHRERIVDLRGQDPAAPPASQGLGAWPETRIFLTNAVQMDVSASGIRDDVMDDLVLDRTDDVPVEVANYIEKYELYR